MSFGKVVVLDLAGTCRIWYFIRYIIHSPKLNSDHFQGIFLRYSQVRWAEILLNCLRVATAQKLQILLGLKHCHTIWTLHQGAIGEELATRGMGVSDGEAVALVVAVRLHLHPLGSVAFRHPPSETGDMRIISVLSVSHGKR